MAKGRKTGGKDFTPGHDRGGRPALPDDVKQLKKLNVAEMERVLNNCLQMNRDQINEAQKNPDAPMIELLVLSIISHGINKGDPMRLNFLLDRLIGKVKESHELDISERTLQILIEETKSEKYAL